MIRGESARLAHLTDDLLDLSRIQAQAVNPQLDWCDLRDVAAQQSALRTNDAMPGVGQCCGTRQR